MKVFLSHSSADKPIVEKVWKVLTPNCSWIDKADIDIGDIILEKISDGIQKCTEFILFWSEASSKSPWVRLELHMAFIKSMEEFGCKLRVVKLDNTDMPLYLKSFLYFNAEDSLEELPTTLLEMLQKDKNGKTKRNNFVNRISELGKIELAIDNEDTRIATLFGIYGIGKRSLIKRANEFIFNQGHFIGVQVKPGFDLVALALELSYKATVIVPQRFNNDAEVITYLETVLESLHYKGYLIALFDVQYWIDEDGGISKELKFLFDFSKKLKVLEKRPIFLTTTRLFNLPIEYQSIHQQIKVDAIAEEHLITIINNWLDAQFGRQEERTNLKQLASMLFGYPFAARIAASMIGKYGVDYLSQYPNEIINLRIDIAKYLISEVKISEEAVKLLETISVTDGPLPAEDIVNVLEYSDDLFRQCVETAISSGLLTHEEGYFKVHPLVQDYYYRSASNRKGFTELTRKLAKTAKIRLEQLEVGTPLHSRLLPSVFRLVALSGSYNEAIQLRHDLLGYLSQVVKDLYDSRDYRLALEYATHILDDNPENWNVKLYYARCLIRLDRIVEAEPILVQMNILRPKDVPILHTLGRMEMARDKWNDALAWFSKAITERANHLPSIRDSAECYFQLKDYQQAEGYVKRAKELDSTNAFVLQVESKILEKQNDYDAAYRVMSMALLQDRNNPSFNHRMGRISELRGDSKKAKEHYERAIECDSKFFESRLSLLSLKIDLGDFTDVKLEIDELEDIIPGRKQEVLRNVKAKYLLEAERDYDNASKLVDLNIRYSREPISYCIRARIEMRKAENQFMQGYSSLANQSLKNAQKFADNGLEIFANDNMLLKIVEEIDVLIRAYNLEVG